nr:hypothetical protein CFP56_11139 [Quercus suber]
MAYINSVLLVAVACVIIQSLAQSVVDTAQNATAFALVYGSPLLAFEKLASLLVAGVGVNTIFHLRTLATASYRIVVKPNVDTLYSTAIFDLSHDNLEITIPDIPQSQAALFSYYDPFGDNFANIGTGNLVQAGRYLLRPRASNTTYGVHTVNGTDGAGYVAYIDSPTTYGILLIRWLVNVTNLDAIHEYQDSTTIESIPNNASTNQAPYLASLPAANSSVGSVENTLNLLAAFAPYNDPEDLSTTSSLAETLSLAGVQARNYTVTPNVNLTLANLTAQDNAINAASNLALPLNNGWIQFSPPATGDFGTNYAFRSAIAASGYLMLRAPNAVYPSWTNTSLRSSSDQASGLGSSLLSLSVDESLLYTFSGKPPVHAETGFWSLTAYGADNYLIPNNQSVYALGDRSNLTYASGSPVYGAKAAANEDGQFQILVQAADVAPPANWTKNWLPAPSGGGNVSLLLRWYGADEALLNGTYVYPVVTRGATVRSTGGDRNGTGSGTNGTQPFVSASGSMSDRLGRVVYAGMTVVLAAMLML